MIKATLATLTAVIGLLIAVHAGVFAQSPTTTSPSPTTTVTVPSGAPATGRGI